MSEQTTAPPVRTAPGVFRSPTSTKARALELLEALGDTADQVAHTLLTGGYHGTRYNGGDTEDNCRTCPIAVYLMRSDLGLHAVSVLGPEVSLHYGPGDGDVEYIDTTDAVDAFVDRFDEGWYSQLVRPVTA